MSTAQAQEQRRPRVGRLEIATLLGILALAALLRFYDLTGESLWYDEAYSVWTSAMDIDSVRILWGWQIEFPLYYLLLHYWMKLFGQGDLAVRALGAVAGILAILPMYAIGRETIRRRGAIAGALLLAVNPYHIWYSQEVRMYALAVLFSLISLYAFWRIWRGARWPWWATHILATGLTFHLHYYVGWLVLVQNLCWFVGMWVRRRSEGTADPAPWWQWLIDQFLVLLLAIPGFAVFLTKLVSHNQWGWLSQRYGPPSILDVVDLLKTFVLATTYNGPTWLGWLLVLAFVGLAAWALIVGVKNWRQGETLHGLVYVLLAFALPILLVFLLGQRWAIWIPRYLLLCLPPFLLFTAWGTASLKPVMGWIATFLLVVGSLYATTGLYGVQQKEDWRGVAAYLSAQMSSDDVLVLMDEECRVPWEHYYSGSKNRIEVSRFADGLALDVAARKAFERSRQGRIWLVVSHADGTGLEQRLDDMPGLKRLSTPQWVGLDLVAYERD